MSDIAFGMPVGPMGGRGVPQTMASVRYAFPNLTVPKPLRLGEISNRPTGQREMPELRSVTPTPAGKKRTRATDSHDEDIVVIGEKLRKIFAGQGEYKKLIASIQESLPSTIHDGFVKLCSDNTPYEHAKAIYVRMPVPTNYQRASSRKELENVVDTMSKVYRRVPISIRAEAGTGKSTALPVALYKRFNDYVFVISPTITHARAASEFVNSQPETRGVSMVLTDPMIDVNRHIIYTTASVLASRRACLANESVSGTLLFDEAHVVDGVTEALRALYHTRYSNVRIIYTSATFGTASVSDIHNKHTTSFERNHQFIPPVRLQSAFENVDINTLWHPDRIGPRTLIFLPNSYEANIAASYYRNQGILDTYVLDHNTDVETMRNMSRSLWESDRPSVMLATSLYETGFTMPTDTVIDFALCTYLEPALTGFKYKRVTGPAPVAKLVQRACRTGRTSSGRAFTMQHKDVPVNIPDLSEIELIRYGLWCAIFSISPQPKTLPSCVRQIRRMGNLLNFLNSPLPPSFTLEFCDSHGRIYDDFAHGFRYFTRSGSKLHLAGVQAPLNVRQRLHKKIIDAFLSSQGDVRHPSMALVPEAIKIMTSASPNQSRSSPPEIAHFSLNDIDALRRASDGGALPSRSSVDSRRSSIIRPTREILQSRSAAGHDDIRLPMLFGPSSGLLAGSSLTSNSNPRPSVARMNPRFGSLSDVSSICPDQSASSVGVRPSTRGPWTAWDPAAVIQRRPRTQAGSHVSEFRRNVTELAHENDTDERLDNLKAEIDALEQKLLNLKTSPNSLIGGSRQLDEHDESNVQRYNQQELEVHPMTTDTTDDELLVSIWSTLRDPNKIDLKSIQNVSRTLQFELHDLENIKGHMFKSKPKSSVRILGISIDLEPSARTWSPHGSDALSSRNMDIIDMEKRISLCKRKLIIISTIVKQMYNGAIIDSPKLQISYHSGEEIQMDVSTTYAHDERVPQGFSASRWRIMRDSIMATVSVTVDNVHVSFGFVSFNRVYVPTHMFDALVSASTDTVKIVSLMRGNDAPLIINAPAVWPGTAMTIWRIKDTRITDDIVGMPSARLRRQVPGEKVMLMYPESVLPNGELIVQYSPVYEPIPHSDNSGILPIEYRPGISGAPIVAVDDGAIVGMHQGAVPPKQYSMYSTCDFSTGLHIDE